MSVNRTIYVGLYADVLNQIDDLYEEKLLPYVEGWSDVEFELIYDGMGGDYAKFGITLCSMKDYYEGDYVFEDDYENLKKKVYNKMKELDLVSENIELNDVKLMIFNHYD